MTYFAYLFQTIHILGLSHPFLSQLLGQCGQAPFTHSRSSLPQGTLDLTRDLCASSFVNHTHVNLCQHLSVNLCQFYVEKHILAKRFRGFRPYSFPLVTCGLQCHSTLWQEHIIEVVCSLQEIKTRRAEAV